MNKEIQEMVGDIVNKVIAELFVLGIAQKEELKQIHAIVTSALTTLAEKSYQSALTSQLSEIEKVVGGMSKKCQMCSNFPTSDIGHDLHIHTYNQALSDLLSILKEERAKIEKEL